MVATIDVFWIGCLISAAVMPMVILMKHPRLGQPANLAEAVH
jgi:hypothetical protein